MKNKPPKFLIAHNVAASEYLYLIHTQQPRFIGIVIPSKGEIVTVDELCKIYEQGARTNRLPSGEYYLMGVIEFYDPVPDPAKLPKLMSRAGDWLFNYMKNLSNEHP